MISAQIDNNKKNEIIEKLKPFQIENSSEYVSFFAKFNDTNLTIYSNSKNLLYKIIINGPIEEQLGRKLELNFTKQAVKTNQEIDYYNDDEQIGSDEVGFGDFFGPIVVVAACCDNKTLLNVVRKYNIQDSKKMNDENILSIVPKFINKVSYSCLLVSPRKLNELFEKGYNLNKIKCILHNQALSNVKKKNPAITNFFVDKFTPETKYYSYISNEPNIVRNVVFMTKGESHFPSVALASVIARYTFLTYMIDQSKKYNTTFPYGASKKVDDFALNLTKKLGIDETKYLVKQTFKNYKTLLDSIKEI